MRKYAADLHQASTEQLLAYARDALDVAGRGPRERHAAGEYVDANAALGTLGQTAEALHRTIDELARTIASQHHSGRIAAVDGPFAGDPTAATTTANFWLVRGQQQVDDLAAAITNAHIAVSGLAHTSR